MAQPMSSFSACFKVKMSKALSITCTTTVKTLTSPILMENSEHIGRVRQFNAECQVMVTVPCFDKNVPNFFTHTLLGVVSQVIPTLKLYEQMYLKYWHHELQFAVLQCILHQHVLSHKPTSYSSIGIDYYGVVKTIQVMSQREMSSSGTCPMGKVDSQLATQFKLVTNHNALYAFPVRN